MASRASQVTISATTPQRTFAVYVDFAVMRVRRGIATDLVATVLRPVDARVLGSLIARAADRADGTVSS